jgi:NADPH:quinone reductase-like Zn-dependent oxidoreductase
MTLTKKILSGVGAVLAIAVISFGIAVSHDSPCGPSPAPAKDAALMKAVVYRCYGSPEVLRLEDVAKPTLADDELLVKVHAASVNPLDWHYMRGTPYLVRLDAGFGAPKNPELGVDFAGTVEAIGSSVTKFKVGDEVFGGRMGSFAEYVRVRESRAVALKPANVSFEQAASVPIAALTALQALRDKGHVQPGQKVLINGASGGVGTFAVQIAKSFGAEVTGVCSGRNVDMVRSLGADRVIDYTKENFTQGDERYDLIVDNVGSHSLSDYRRVLKPEGTYVMVGGPNKGVWIGPLIGALKAAATSAFVSQKLEMMLAELKPEDLALMAELMQSGKVTPVIDRRYRLQDVPAAIAYLEEGHARGKVIIDMAEAPPAT